MRCIRGRTTRRRGVTTRRPDRAADHVAPAASAIIGRPEEDEMTTGRERLLFGFNAPPGDREMGRVDRATFVADQDRLIGFAARFFDSVWISDHVMEGDRYRIEPWTQMTWLAARFPSITLGHNVLCNSYRHPPLMAKMAASIDALTGGRFILGYGAGWLEPEYRGYGYDFPPTKVRIAQMEEAVRLIRTMWTDSPATFEGEWYRVQEAYCEPRPDRHPPILIAGEGEQYLLRAVAKHADWWLSYGHRVEVLERKLNVLADHCREIGRNVDEIRKATPLTVYLRRSADDARRWAGDAVNADQPAFAGDPTALRDRLTELHALGFDMVQLRFADLMRSEDVALFADEVLPHFR
jgi:alkanesulfonate monooxygenase SsuD/methylene tetrahydromethanopterin reductase-like flavin-dependent oxidoreductase (luciferase family)